MKLPVILLQSALVLTLLLRGTLVQANQELLLNGDLDAGGAAPAHWTVAVAGGEFAWTEDDGRNGSRGARLGSEDGGYALLYQRVAAAPGDGLTFKGWTRRAAGTGHGELKLEFDDAQGRRIGEHVRPLHAAGEWARFFITGQAPAGTASATAVIVGLDGGALHFDDLSLSAGDPDAPLTFDVAHSKQTFKGFGTQVWAYPSTPDYPELASIRAQALSDFSIRYVRVENYFESSSWDDLRALRATTDARDIEWIYMVWAAPGALETDAGLLADVGAFARWWARHAAGAYANGVPVEYIELMNEPDSGGQWSTGISHGQYARLVTQTRRRLDRMGLDAVGIVGPGTSSTSWSAPDGYINALSPAGVAAMAAWSTHTWADDAGGVYPEGPVATAGQWPTFAAHAQAQGPEKLRMVTEYATKLNTFDGVTYRPADVSPWDDDLAFPYHNVTNSQPYAAHVYANTLALLNAEHGAEALLLWQLIDEPTEVLDKGKGWGMIDLWGNGKPVAGAMRTLTDALKPGARVVSAPDQAYKPVYSGAFIDDEQVVLALANVSGEPAVTGIRLEHAPAGLALGSARLHQRILAGDPERGEPDVSATQSVSVVVSPGMEPGTYDVLPPELPPWATLTIVLDTSAR